MDAEFAFELAPIDPSRRRIEVVERKGVGHPDTLCDAAADAFSRRLSRAYLDAGGRVLHHNVDKALLSAGRTCARFGGGEWLEPIVLTLAGRATASAGSRAIPVDEIGREAAREALGSVRHLDPRDERQVEIRVAVRPGAADLREVFDASLKEVPRANDTSIGVGFAPRSPIEALAHALDARLGRLVAQSASSPLGEDTKLMLVRDEDAVRITLAVAMVASRVANEAAYVAGIEEIRAATIAEARAAGFEHVELAINAADQPGRSRYLTVSGTSAECGDDGQVGRGNRCNGLITPMRPMTLEAHAGKNPCTHVGKLLSIAASRAADACAGIEGVRAAECVLVSRIGAPVSDPQSALVRLDAPSHRAEKLEETAQAIVAEQCRALPEVWRELVGCA